MNFDDAIRATEIILGFALSQQCIEHMASANRDRIYFALRLLLSMGLIFGVQLTWVLVFLMLAGIFMLHRYQGPYNGGSDRMSLLILFCLGMVHLAPSDYWKEVAFGYLAIQLVLSYFISGLVKIVNPEWRNGRALNDVFLFSTYPVSDSLRSLSNYPRLLFIMSWNVMLFELLFPVLLLSVNSLIVALAVASSFHLANACLFGLNRFLWVWVAAFPSLIWFQSRFIVIS